MAAVVPNSSMVYSQGVAGYSENIEIPVIQTRAPTAQDTKYPVGKRWINTLQNTVYTLSSFSYSNLVITANWYLLNVPTFVAEEAATVSLDTSGTTTVLNGNAIPSRPIYIARKAIAGTASPNSVPGATVLNGSFVVKSTAGDTSTLYYLILN